MSPSALSVMSTKTSDSQTNDPSPAHDPNPIVDLGPVADTIGEPVDPRPSATEPEYVALPRTKKEDWRHQSAEWFNSRRVELLPHERAWMERHQILLEQGFQLRPRFRPGWQPSWTGSGGNAIQCEDGEILRVSNRLCSTLVTGS